MAIGNKRSLNFKNIEMFAFKLKVVAVSFVGYRNGSKLPM